MIPGNQSQMSDITADQENIQQQRHEQSEALYEQAHQLFQNAQMQGFNDKEPLEEVTDLLTRSIRSNRKNPRPFTLMAYILLLVNDRIRAERYVRDALKADPEHLPAQQLYEGIEELKYSEFIQNAQRAPHEEAMEILEKITATGLHKPSQYDLLYDETEQFIIKQSRLVMDWAEEFPAEPQYESNAYKILAMFFKALSSIKNCAEHHLELLDEEFETHELAQMMRPLNTLNKRYEQAFLTSKQLQDADKNINRCVQMAKQLEKMYEAKKIPKDAEQRFEKIYDLSALIGEQFENIGDLDIDVSALAENFETMTSYVQKVHEKYDDL